MNESHPRQVVVTAVFGSHAERLDETFSSFLSLPFLEAHAFIMGDSLPTRQVPNITYHLVKPDARFLTPIRDADYRRWTLIDELDADYALVVDGVDVGLLRPIPTLPELLRGGIVAAGVEHSGGRWLEGRIYTSNFVNAGVTVWNVSKSRELRHKIHERGLTRYRNDVDDQLALNEILHAEYLDELTLLPCIYNYRVYVRTRKFGWATTQNLDGVRIYHTDDCHHAMRMVSEATHPALQALEPDAKPLTARQRRWRRWIQGLRTRRAGRF